MVGASMRAVRSIKEALGALRAGALARTTAATNMNSSSSRSHAVFTLLMRQRRLAADQDVTDKEVDAEAPEQYETLTAKFHFVDLAGSERLKRTGNCKSILILFKRTLVQITSWILTRSLKETSSRRIVDLMSGRHDIVRTITS